MIPELFIFLEYLAEMIFMGLAAGDEKK